MKFFCFYFLIFFSINCLAKTPDDLLIYYGFPSAINGAVTLDDAARDFGEYDIVVIGDCIQEDGSSANPLCPTPHPDNANVETIIQSPLAQRTRFFGYIPIGVRQNDPNLDIAEITRRVTLWERLGVDGILLDQFGSEFSVTRERQNEAIAIVHSLGLSVIANGFVVDDVFSTTGVDPVNGQPRDPTELISDDFYLFESHQITEGNFVGESDWQDKANLLESFREDIGFQILSITTNNDTNIYSEEQFFYSWHSAAMYGHAATGWGEFTFSAGLPDQPQTDFAPFRERPTVELDTFITPLPPIVRDSLYQRTTCNGMISVNAAVGMEGFDFMSADFCQSTQTPDDLLIYYGFPSLINGALNNSQAAAYFGEYDIVVLGDCIPEDGSVPMPPGCDPKNVPHPDRVNAENIISAPETRDTLFFGYIALGLGDEDDRQNLDMEEIERRAELWRGLGVKGILLDQYGHEFEVTRQRQNDAVNFIHSLGLTVIANGFVVDDVFSTAMDPVNNPPGDSTALESTDYYLYESHQFGANFIDMTVDFVEEVDWQLKANRIMFFRQQSPFKVLSITTSLVANDFTSDRFFYSWHSAALYEHTATGWGEPVFSAGDNMATFRTRPNSPIDSFITPIPMNPPNSTYERTACSGLLTVIATEGAESSSFMPDELCLILRDSFENKPSIQ